MVDDYFVLVLRDGTDGMVGGCCCSQCGCGAELTLYCGLLLKLMELPAAVECK